MKVMKMPFIFCVMLLLTFLAACGADDIKHKKSDHWDVAFQRSTGSFSITYTGDETQINDLVYGATGKNIDQHGKLDSAQETPFKISGVITDSEKNKDPINFFIEWNDKRENVIFE